MTASIENQLIDSSRMVIDIVTANIGNNQKLFDEAVTLALQEKDSISPRAARVMYWASLNHPALFKPHVNYIINILPTLRNESVIFCIMRLFTEKLWTNDEDNLGILADFCFNYLEKKVDRVAIKIYAIQILYNISFLYPDIKIELKAIITDQYNKVSAGFKSVGKNILKKLEKEIDN